MSGVKNPDPIKSKTSHTGNSGNHNRTITVGSGLLDDFIYIAYTNDDTGKARFFNISRKAAKRLVKALNHVRENH